MNEDFDIKLAGDRPSFDVNKTESGENAVNIDKNSILSAKELGKQIAEEYIKDVTSQSANSEHSQLLLQRKLLLSFTATAGFEKYIQNDALIGFAQKSFLDTLKKAGTEIYTSSSDTGAFSFYYLAFRRGTEIERRIGQTFAMLCSHDGDPIFQELGEALFCWFSDRIRKAVKEKNL